MEGTMTRRMIIAVAGIVASVVIAWAVEAGACGSAFAYCNESTRFSFLHPSLTASDVFLPKTHLHLSRYDQDGSSQSEREPKATIWLGYSGGSGLGTILLSFETFREKSSFEVSLGAVSSGASENSGTALSVGIATNFYPEPDFGAENYQNLYYGGGVGRVFASGGGASAQIPVGRWTYTNGRWDSQRQWQLHKVIGWMGLISFLVCLTLLMTVGGGGTNTPPNPLWQTTRVVGAEGATIETPEQYGAKVEIAPNTFSSETQVGVQVYPVEMYESSLPDGVVPVSHVIRVTFGESASFEQAASITITLPTPATRQESDGWYLVTTYFNSTSPIVLTGVHQSKRTDSLTFEIKKEDIDKLFEINNESTLTIQSTNLNYYDATVRRIFSKSIETTFRNWNGSRWPKATPSSWEGKRVAILVHGIRNDIDALSQLAKLLSELCIYDEIWGMNYDWTKHIQDNGIELANFISAHATDTTRIDIYGHSMGGLVARYALEKMGASRYVERLYTFGTPHLGVPLNDPTDFPPGNGFCNVLAVIDEFIPLLLGLNSKGVKDLLENSDFLRTINDENISSKNTIYIVFSGNNHKDYFYDFGECVYSNIYRNALPCDGIVAVYSAAPFLSDSNSNREAEAVCKRRGWSNITKTKGAIWIHVPNAQSLPLNHSDLIDPTEWKKYGYDSSKIIKELTNISPS